MLACVPTYGAGLTGLGPGRYQVLAPRTYLAVFLGQAFLPSVQLPRWQTHLPKAQRLRSTPVPRPSPLRELRPQLPRPYLSGVFSPFLPTCARQAGCSLVSSPLCLWAFVPASPIARTAPPSPLLCRPVFEGLSPDCLSREASLIPSSGECSLPGCLPHHLCCRESSCEHLEKAETVFGEGGGSLHPS